MPKKENVNKSNEISAEENYDNLVNFIVNRWKEKGSIINEEETKECIDAMLFLISNYNLKCLINTLFELYELVDEFEETNNK